VSILLLMPSVLTLGVSWRQAIAPFVFCMFAMVRVLTNTGFTGRFAAWMVNGGGSSVVGVTLVYGYTSALLVNVLNDLPSTVFWSTMVPVFCRSYSRRHYTVRTLSSLVYDSAWKSLSLYPEGLCWRGRDGVDGVCLVCGRPSLWRCSWG
jgi:Na+/H+ antiporter NhaD/arsenite permease-like protein